MKLDVNQRHNREETGIGDEEDMEMKTRKKMRRKRRAIIRRRRRNPKTA